MQDLKISNVKINPKVYTEQNVKILIKVKIQPYTAWLKSLTSPGLVGPFYFIISTFMFVYILNIE